MLKHSMHDPQLPFVFLNLAMTADGKIAPYNRQFVPFGSKRDQRHMLELRATADAVMSGARTVDLGDVSLGPGSEKYRKKRLQNGLPEYNLRVVVSGTGTISPDSTIFKDRFSPIIVLTSENAPRERRGSLQGLASSVKAFGTERIDFREAFRWLKKEWNVNRLLCEGGGELNGALFEQDLVDEIHLTLCPVVFGGRTAPTISDGEGIPDLGKANRFVLTSQKRFKDELFLVYSRKQRA